MLSEILDEVAADIARSRVRDYDRHEVFGGFFFGHSRPDARLQTALRESVPSALIECTALRNDGEPAAADAARHALTDFAIDAGRGGKKIILVCNDACDVALDYDAARASSDPALIAHLWCDLKMNTFKRIGNVMAGRQ